MILLDRNLGKVPVCSCVYVYVCARVSSFLRAIERILCVRVRVVYHGLPVDRNHTSAVGHRTSITKKTPAR